MKTLREHDQETTKRLRELVIAVAAAYREWADTTTPLPSEELLNAMDECLEWADGNPQ